MQEFKLLEGEQILEEIKPQPALKKYFGITYSALALVFYACFGWWIPVLFFKNFALVIPMMILFLVIFLVLAAFFAQLAYSKYHYWITNKRVIVKRGLLGYSIISIPYERISDVIVSHSFLEQLCGIASLHIQSLAGQITYGKRGSEGTLLAVPNPEGLQVKILELVKEKRKEEHLSF
jgi:uncharacterized membrane protein YdbT with pleckstrin-like domain